MLFRSENKIKKPLLKEGRYDKITGDVVRDIIELVKTEKDGYFQLPDYYEQEGLSFSVEVSIEKSNNPITFEVDAFTLKNFDDDLNDIEEEDENIMYLSILLGSKFSQQNFQKLYYKLQEDVRHEIEHFTQEGPYRIEDRPKYDENTSELPPLEHHLNISEIPALVHGFYRRAKLEKKQIGRAHV